MEGKTVQALKAHLALNVSDVEKSIEFYRRMLGIEPSKVRKGYAKFDVQNPPLNLTLNEGRVAGHGALSHLGIQVGSTEDVLTTRARWRSAGLETYDEMQTNCCYAIQDKTWVRDPDGYEWEAFVVLEDNLAETSMCCVTDATGQAGASEQATCATAPETTAEARATEGASVSNASCCGEASATVNSASCCETATAPVTLSR